MPSIAQIPVSNSITGSPPSGKKRKREQVTYGDEEDHVKTSSIQHISPPLPTSRHFLTTSAPGDTPSHPQHHSLLTASRVVLKPRPLKPLLRPHDAKRQRIFTAAERLKPEISSNITIPEHGISPTTSSADAHARPHEGPLSTSVLRCSVAKSESEGYTRTDLRSCHICHQKPKVRTDLDSYGDCEGCAERTCYVCMRECLGPPLTAAVLRNWEGERGRWSETGGEEMSFVTGEERPWARDGMDEWGFQEIGGLCEDGEAQTGWRGDGTGEWGHRGMVCSRCCVERGVDGEVRCLGCLRAEEGA